MDNSLFGKGIVFGAFVVALLMFSNVIALNITSSISTSKDSMINIRISPALFSLSTPPNIEWDKTYGGSTDEYGMSIYQTYDKGFIVAGYKISFEGSSQILAIKVSSDGTEEWSKTYGPGKAHTIQETADKRYIILATEILESKEVLFRLIKLDSNGHQIWNKSYYGGGDYDFLNEGWQTSDGGYVMVGTKMTKMFDTDVWLIKTDSQGIIQWEKTYDNSEILYTFVDAGWSVQERSDGGYIIAGTTTKVGLIDIFTNVWLIETDSNGKILNDNTFGETFHQAMWLANSVRETTDGGFIVAGSRNQEGDICMNYWVLKTDSNLHTNWIYQEIHGSEKFEGFLCVRVTIDGGGIIIGQGANYNPSEYTYYSKLLKLDENGREDWHINFNNSMFNAVEQTSDRGYIVVGESNGDVRLIKLEGDRRPNLECEGSLSWSNIKAGSTVTGAIYVKNVGAHYSELNWEVCEIPTWGTWTFNPSRGENLKPEDDKITVQVTIVAPNEQNKQYTGKIKICNREDSSDYCVITVFLTTSKNKLSTNTPFSLFLQILEKLFE